MTLKSLAAAAMLAALTTPLTLSAVPAALFAVTAPPAVTEIAVFGKSVAIGTIRNSDRWRCNANINGTVYFTTGNTELATRKELEQAVGVGATCRIVNPIF